MPLVLVVGVSLAAPLAGAQELSPAPKAAAPNPQPIAAAAAAKVEGLEPAEAALATTQATEPDPTTSDAKSFFKSPKGILALTLAVAGVGYTIYSSQHDRITSPIR